MEPWGAERTDAGFALLAAQQYNINRKKGAKAMRPVDFMPDFEGTSMTSEKPTSQDAVWDKLSQFFDAHNQRVALDPRQPEEERQKAREELAKSAAGRGMGGN